MIITDYIVSTTLSQLFNTLHLGNMKMEVYEISYRIKDPPNRVLNYVLKIVDVFRVTKSEKTFEIHKIRYLWSDGPRVRHSDALQIENDDAAQDLRPGFQDTQLEDDHRCLEDLLHGIFPGVPVSQSVYHHSPAAVGPVRRHCHHIVVSDVVHLHWADILMDLWVFLFEVVVIHYLPEDSVREMDLTIGR